jgi:Spy/CpxP family protein refolding chaperone
MKKLLLIIAVVVVGTSALVLAGRAGGFGRRGYANGPGWRHPGFGGMGLFGPLYNWQGNEMPPLMLGMLDLTDEQKEAIAKLVEESRAKLHVDIEAVLTAEQLEELEQLRESIPWETGRPGGGYLGIGPRGPFAGPDAIPPVLEALDLTEEQETLIAEIREKARTDAAAAETREARREIMQTAHDEILSVLTDEQIEKLEQLCPRAPWELGRGYLGIGPRGPFAGPDGIPPALEALDLTEEQKTAIEAICEEARTDAEAAETRQARREIMQAAHDEILALLTDEQIEQLEQLCPWAPWGRGRW